VTLFFYWRGLYLWQICEKGGYIDVLGGYSMKKGGNSHKIGG
jgi:hypothetical protein